MNIAIVGYGRMGKQIEKILIEKNINIGSVVDKFNPDAKFKEVNDDSLKGIDVAIDFSTADCLMNNIDFYVKNNISCVIGTTGWYDKIEEVKNKIGNKIGFIWSGNFSIGVHIFFRIVREGAKIFNNFEDYDAMLYEIHHNQKVDSPSGTAKMIGDILLQEIKRKKDGVEEKLDRKIAENEIHIASVRGGYVPGTHVVMFDSPVDSIELKHTARNREGMARGAVIACQWIKDKKGFFNIDDLMNTVL